jgi:hypothetical protein
LFRIIREVADIEIVLEAKTIGKDFLLTLAGGREHIGAVAVGIFDEKSQMASSSVITAPGHREDQLALLGARLVSKATKKTTVLIAGIHRDNINSKEIKKIVSTAEEMIQAFIDLYESEGIAGRSE